MNRDTQEVVGKEGLRDMRSFFGLGCVETCWVSGNNRKVTWSLSASMIYQVFAPVSEFPIFMGNRTT